MNAKEFNEKVFNNNNIIWLDKTGIYKIDEFRNAEIELERGMYSNYDRYIVTIVHKVNGTITKKGFLISQYMNVNTRIDNLKNTVYQGNFSVAQKSNSFNWCVAIPPMAEIEKLTSAIINFINLYK